MLLREEAEEASGAVSLLTIFTKHLHSSAPLYKLPVCLRVILWIYTGYVGVMGRGAPQGRREALNLTVLCFSLRRTR